MAKQARERKQRQTARHVAWLSDLLRDQAVHHTAPSRGRAQQMHEGGMRLQAQLQDLAARLQAVEKLLGNTLRGSPETASTPAHTASPPAECGQEQAAGAGQAPSPRGRSTAGRRAGGAERPSPQEKSIPSPGGSKSRSPVRMEFKQDDAQGDQGRGGTNQDDHGRRRTTTTTDHGEQHSPESETSEACEFYEEYQTHEAEVLSSSFDGEEQRAPLPLQGKRDYLERRGAAGRLTRPDLEQWLAYEIEDDEVSPSAIRARFRELWHKNDAVKIASSADEQYLMMLKEMDS